MWEGSGGKGGCGEEELLLLVFFPFLFFFAETVVELHFEGFLEGLFFFGEGFFLGCD